MVAGIGAIKRILHFRDWLDWIVTDCPLCQSACSRGGLCDGCRQDTFVQRQQRALCVGCASDLENVDHFKPVRTAPGHDVRRMCRPCQRSPAPYAWLDCALDGGFPEALMLDRFSGQRTDLCLAPVLADLVLQSFGYLLKSDPTREGPDCWMALPATQQKLAQCRCNPAHELARALAKMTGLSLRSAWLTVTYSQGDDRHNVVDVNVSAKVAGRSVGLVLDQLDALDPVVTVAQALRVAGARQVAVVCAARNHSLWQNHAHVSCDPG